MKTIRNIEIKGDNNEECLPGFLPDFPYIASCAELHHYAKPFIPWHWHKAVEVFIIEKGRLEYETAGDRIVFEEGSGGMVNSNVLHRTCVFGPSEVVIQKLHLFDPSFLSGPPGGRVEQRYFIPMLGDPLFELLPLDQKNPEEAEVLELIQKAFLLNERETGYEIRLKCMLLDIWIRLYGLYQKLEHKASKKSKNTDAIKRMLLYIHEHWRETIKVKTLAETVFLSERECYRLFQECLHMTPANYIIRYRTREACRMLTETEDSVTEIAYRCGFGSGSYFSRIFRREMGCTPIEYRISRQNKTKNSQ